YTTLFRSTGRFRGHGNGDHQGGFKIELEHAEVAVEGVVRAAQRAWRAGEVVVAAAAGAHRTVHAPAPVEAAGAAVHMLEALPPAEVSGIGEARHVDVEHGEVEVIAVGGGLEGIGGDGQAGGGERAEHLAAPAADVDLVAIVHQEGRGGDVRHPYARAGKCTEAGAPQGGGEAVGELGQELPAGGDEVGGTADQIACRRLGLAEEVDVVRRIDPHEVELVVTGAAVVGGGEQGAPVGAEGGHEGIGGATLVGGMYRTRRYGQVDRAGAPRDEDVAVAVLLHGVCGIGLRAAEVGAPDQGGEGGVQFEQHGIVAAPGEEGAVGPGRGGEVLALRATGHQDVPAGRQFHLAA